MIDFLKNALLVFIGGASAGTGGFWTYLRSKKTRKVTSVIDAGKLELENRREDGAAYERASRINQQIVAGLREELTALQETIRDLRTDLTLERQKSAYLEEHSAQLEAHIRNLEASAAAMRGLLGRAGIEYEYTEGTA